MQSHRTAPAATVAFFSTSLQSFSTPAARYREPLLSCAAACASCLELLRLLIAAGADVNHAGKDGATPLYNACTGFNTEGARLLVKGGADVNAATCEGETPLMNAALGSHAEMVKILLKAGADVNAVDALGCTALDAAAAAGFAECTRLLHRAGGRMGRASATTHTRRGFSLCAATMAATNEYAAGHTRSSTTGSSRVPPAHKRPRSPANAGDLAAIWVSGAASAIV